jgi:cell volume regulation protein A
MIPIEYILLGASVLLLISILASKGSDRFGIPSLLIFLGIGMLAGSDGPGGIYFDDPYLALFPGIIALSFILFAGGLDTNRDDVRPVLRQGVLLSTVGVLITALLVGTVLKPGDRLLVFADKKTFATVRSLVEREGPKSA